MPYYGANVDAKLFMGQSTAAVLPDPGADVFDEVALTGTITPPPVSITSAFFSVTNDNERRSVGGRKADQIVDGSLVIDWDETTHQNMFADVNVAGGQKRNWYIEYPTGRRLDFVAFASSWTEDPFDAAAEATEHRATFQLTVDGGITVTP